MVRYNYVCEGKEKIQFGHLQISSPSSIVHRECFSNVVVDPSLLVVLDDPSSVGSVDDVLLPSELPSIRYHI